MEPLVRDMPHGIPLEQLLKEDVQFRHPAICLIQLPLP